MPSRAGEHRALGGDRARENMMWDAWYMGRLFKENKSYVNTEWSVSRTELDKRSEVGLEKLGEREVWSSWYKV